MGDPMMVTIKPFSVTLKALRVNAEMTLDDAANAIGTTITTLRSWEAHKTFPDFKQIQRICQVYKCGIDNIRFVVPENIAKSDNNTETDS